MTPIDLRHIPFEATEPEFRGKTLVQAEANLSFLRRETLAAMEQTPHCGFYHTEVIDEVAAGRLRALLGLEPLEGQAKEVCQRVSPGGWTLQMWREEIKEILRQESFIIENEFLCGSAAQYVANLRLLIRGLSLLACNRVIKPGEIYDELERRIRRISFGYQDVDINIEVKRQLNFSLRNALSRLPHPPGVIVKVKGPNHFLIISIKDEKTKESLDFSIYKDRENPYLITADSLRVLISKEPGKGNLVSYNCPNLWNYWKAHVLRLADRPQEMNTDSYILPRLIDLETRKHRVTTWALEDYAFKQWWDWIQNQGPLVHFERLRAVFEEHEPSPLGRQCQLLRWAQVLQKQQVEGINHYFKQLARPELLNGAGQPFLYECLHMLKNGGLLILELAGLAALQEGWKEPFSARIEFHEEKPVLRLRFRQGEIKRSLLLRYSPEETLSELKSKHLNWDKMTAALHLLWNKPILRRDQTDGFHKDRWLRTDLSGQIRAYFLKLTGITPSQAKLTLGTHSSLAALIFPDLFDLSSLEELAIQLLKKRAGSDTDRVELCWKIVERLLDQHNYQTAATIISKLREKEWNFPKGYANLLVQLFTKHPKAPPELLQAVSPQGMLFTARSITIQTIVEADDHSQVDARDYWKLVQELKLSPASVSPDMLTRLQEIAPEKLWVVWVVRKWKNKEEHPALCSAVSRLILEKAREGIWLPFLQDRTWFFSFIQNLNRFQSDDEGRLLLFERLAAEGASLEEQEKLLRNWNLKNQKAWDYLVQGYLLRNNQILDLGNGITENWNSVLSYADPDFAMKLLEGPLKGVEPPGGREAFTAAILTRWGNIQPQISFLAKLIPDIHWESICQENEIERLLFRLLKVDQFLLGSHLLLSIKPDTVKYEFVYRAWATCLEKRVEMFRSPIILKCVRLNPEKIWNLCLASLPSESIWPLVAHIGLNPELLNVTQVTALLKAALNAEPSGNVAREIQERFGKEKFKNEGYLTILCELAAAQLISQNGDLHFAIEIFSKSDPTPYLKFFPKENRLNALLRLNCTEWVLRILENASNEDLALLSQEFFIKLISVHLKEKAEMRARVLLHPPKDGEFLLSYWEALIENENLELKFQCKLFTQHNQYKVSVDRIGELANRLLGRVRIARSELPPDTRRFLFDLIPRLPENRAHSLWNSLRQILKPSKSELFRTAMFLWEKGPLPDGTLLWLMDNLNKERIKLLEEQLPLLSDLSLPLNQLERYVLPAIIHTGSWQYYWILLKRHPELPLPLPAYNAPFDELILQRIKTALRSPTYESLMLIAALELHYRLGFAEAIYKELYSIPKEKVADPLNLTILLLSLRLPKDVREILDIVKEKCPLPLQMSDILPLLTRPELKTGIRGLIEAIPDCHSRRELLVRLCYEKIQGLKKTSPSEVMELANLMHRYYALLVPGKKVFKPEESPVQTISSLIMQLPVEERQEPCKALLNLGLAIPPTVEDYGKIRDLILDFKGLDRDGSILGFHYLIKTFVALEGKYQVEPKDRTILDFHGNKMKGEGSPPIDLQRLMCEAVEISDRYSSQKKGVMKVLVRARLGLGLWDGVKLNKKNDLWIRSTRMFLQEQLKNAEDHEVERVAYWMKDFLSYINDLVEIDEVLSLCGMVRLAWLNRCGEANVMKKLSELLVLVPIENGAKKALTEACKDFLTKYPHHIGNLLDTLFEKNWYNIQDQNFIKELISLMQDAGLNNAQRPHFITDWNQLILFNEEHILELSSTHYVHQLILLRKKEKWNFEHLFSTWSSFFSQKAHRYPYLLLTHLTETFLKEQGSTKEGIQGGKNSIPKLLKIVRSSQVAKEAIPVLLEVSLPYLRELSFESSYQLICDVVEPDLRDYYLGSMPHSVLTPKVLVKVIPSMPKWTWHRCFRKVNNSYCGPLGPMTDGAINNVIETFFQILQVFFHAPKEIETCVKCLNTLSNALLETTMTPQRYKHVLSLMLKGAKETLHNEEFTNESLTVVLNFFQELMVSVNPYFGLSEDILLTFSLLAAAEGDIDRLSFIDCTLIEDNFLYKYLTGRDSRSEADLDENLNWLRNYYVKCPRRAPHLQKILNRLELSPLPFKKIIVQENTVDLQQLIDRGDGRKAVQLWKQMNQQGKLDGWNDHWNLFFLSEEADCGERRILAETCCLMPLNDEQIAIWTEKASTLIPKIGNRKVMKKLLWTFIEKNQPVPSHLISLFVSLHIPIELDRTEILNAFSENSWIGFYPHLVDRYLQAGGFVSLNFLWNGWLKYRDCGADPDQDGITEKLLTRSLVGDIAISNSILNRLLCQVYRDRKSQVYGHLPFLFLAEESQSQVFSAWEQLTIETPSTLQGWSSKRDADTTRLAFLIDVYGFQALRLLNISRKKGWIDLHSCELIIAKLNTNSIKLASYLDRLMKDALNQDQREDAKETVSHFVELLLAVGNGVPMDVLQIVNKVCCDRTDPLEVSWISDQFSDLLAQIIPLVEQIHPNLPAVDNALYNISQMMVRQLTQGAAISSDVRSILSSTWNQLAVIFSNRKATQITRFHFNRSILTPSVTDTAIRSMLIWEGFLGTTLLNDTLQQSLQYIIPRMKLLNKKARHLISIWGSILGWMRRLQNIGDSSQFIICWEQGVRTCITSRMKKEKRQLLLDQALRQIAEFVIYNKDNFDQIISCLNHLSAGRNETQELSVELKKVVEEHLNKLGDEKRVKYFRGKLIKI